MKRSTKDASGRTRGCHTPAPHEETPGWKVNIAGPAFFVLDIAEEDEPSHTW